MTTTSPGSLAVLAALSTPTGLILASDAAHAGLHHELRREFERRTVVRLRRGVYTLAAEWNALGADARYLRRIHAHAAMAEAPAVYSHFSAAALWGLPIVGAWPPEIHLATTAWRPARHAELLALRAGAGEQLHAGFLACLLECRAEQSRYSERAVVRNVVRT